MSILHTSVMCNYSLTNTKKYYIALGDHPYLLRHLIYIPMYLPNGEKAYTCMNSNLLEGWCEQFTLHKHESLWNFDEYGKFEPN